MPLPVLPLPVLAPARAARAPAPTSAPTWPDDGPRPSTGCRGEPPEPVGQTLSAPETVHLAITGRCNLSCPGCYVPPQGAGPELTATEWRGLIDQWADLHVFQLAVGGGEPLLYEGLYDLLAYARQRGIVSSLTTNGTLLTADVVRRLERAGVARVNVSWNGPDDRREERSSIAVRALRLLLDSTVQAGVNVLVTHALLPHLPELFAHLHMLGVRRVTILRPKPPVMPQPNGLAWYDANQLRRADLQRLRATLSAWRGALALEVDCALTGLMAELPPAILHRRGIYGCTAGRRICTVWPDGRVTPCSFLADRSAGDMRRTPFAELWQRGQNWELLRAPVAWPGHACAVCDTTLQEVQ